MVKQCAKALNTQQDEHSQRHGKWLLEEKYTFIESHYNLLWHTEITRKHAPCNFDTAHGMSAQMTVHTGAPAPPWAKKLHAVRNLARTLVSR